MRRLLLYLVLSSAVYAQTSVPAVVIDSTGKSAHGLQKSDFSVDCGKGTTLETVEEVGPVTVSNFADPIPVFILYDAPSITLPMQEKVAKLILTLLRTSVNEHLPLTVLENTGTGVQVIHDLSIDPTILAAALDRIDSGKESSEGPARSGGQDNIKQAVARLQALRRAVYPNGSQYVSGQLGPTPGLGARDNRPDSLRLVAKMLQRSRSRKLLIWITGEFFVPASSMVVDPVTKSYRLCQGEGECAEFNSTRPRSNPSDWPDAIHALNKSRISVYPIHISVSPRNVTECCFTPVTDPADSLLAMLARTTAGQRVVADKELDFASVIAETRYQFGSYYLLTVTPGTALKEHWSNCSVTVNKPDLKTSGPMGFFPLR